jgi:hypothetical protein
MYDHQKTLQRIEGAPACAVLKIDTPKECVAHLGMGVTPKPSGSECHALLAVILAGYSRNHQL